MGNMRSKIRKIYRIGGDDLLEEMYGIRINKEDKNLHRQIEEVIVDHEETLKALAEEEEKTDEKELLEKMEYLDSLDINQLRSMAKNAGIVYKTLMKMKKEEIIAELLK